MISERPLLRVAAGIWPPWADLITRTDNSIEVTGIMANIFAILTTHLNVDYTILQAPGNSWGGMTANGSFYGMIGMIHRNEVDMAMGPFSVSSSRFKGADFSMIIYNDILALATPRPTVRTDIDGFLKPFSFHVWLLILLSLAAISVSSGIVTKVEATLFSKGDEENPFVQAVLWSVKALTQESSEWLPNHDGGRFLVTTWLLASLIFMSSYNGILVAMLSVPRVQIPVDSLEDLVSQDELTWKLVGPGYFSYNYLKASEKEVHQKAISGASSLMENCWTNKTEVLAGEYVALCTGMTLKRIISWDFSNTGTCRLYIARKPVYSNDLNALALRKNSPYLEKTNIVLNSLIEAGLINYWISQALNNITKCMKPPSVSASEEEIKALNIEGLGGLFLFLITCEDSTILI